MKTAFLFPGQGAQHVRMGYAIAEAFPEAAALFQKANDIVGYNLSSICFEGPQEKLNSTVISQPAIFTVSAAILQVMRSKEPTVGIVPAVTAGLSLGEYTALYAAELISFEDCLRLVQKRGEAMQAAAELSEGGMVSIIGLQEDEVRELCREAGEGEILVGVNFNCPGQIVISGSKKACQRAADLAENYGAIKAVPLAVAGAFHTTMMKSAAKELRKALDTCNIAEPKDVQVIANVSAEYYKTKGQIIEGLTQQLISPILWQKCMERLLADGVELFYEIGPGKVLTGLAKRINRKTNITNVSDLPSLNKLLAS